LEFDLSGLLHFDKPALLTHGTESPPFFLMALNIISKAIPNAKRLIFEGAGHVPHMSHPQQYMQTLKQFCTSYQEV